jgi:hypothetical protein
MKSREDLGIGAFIALWAFIVLINIAWIGTLIWAIIYVVTHLGEWFG